MIVQSFHDSGRKGARRLTSRSLLIAQCALVTLVFAAAVIWPRPGQAVLLVPLNGGVALVRDMRESGAFTLVARGRIAGSVVVQPERVVPIVGLLMRGVVPLGVPRAGCGRSGP